MSWDKSGSPTETALVLRRPPLFSTLRIYDTNALWRHDEIIRIRHLEVEIAALQKEMEDTKRDQENRALSADCFSINSASVMRSFSILKDQAIWCEMPLFDLSAIRCP